MIDDRLIRFVISRYVDEDLGGYAHAYRVSKAGRTEDEQIVGLLHDSIEDGYITGEELRERKVPEDCVRAVEILARQKGKETYREYIQRIVREYKTGSYAGELALKVKFNDIYDHLHPNRKLFPSSKTFVLSHAQRYLKALAVLVEAHVHDEHVQRDEKA